MLGAGTGLVSRMVRRISQMAIGICCIVGFAAAAAEREVLTDPMTQTSQWELGGSRVFYRLGNAKLQATTEVHREGEPASLALKYDFTHKWRSYFSLIYKGEAVPGKCAGFSFWVCGDASGHGLRVRIEDAERRYYEKDVRAIDFTGWEHVTVSVGSGEGWKQSMRRGDPRVPPTFPIALRQINFVRNRESKVEEGQICFHDLRSRTAAVPIDEVGITLATEKTGNLFYRGDKVAVTARLSNPTKERIAGALATRLTDFFGKQVEQERDVVRLAAGQRVEQTLPLQPWGLGWYRVDVIVKNETGGCSKFLELGISTPAEHPGLQPQSPFGMNIFSFGREKQRGHSFKIAQEAGVKWMRLGMHMASLEPEKGLWAWDTMPQWCEGKWGKALHLRSRHLLVAADSPSLNSPTKTGELTIEFWIKFHKLDYDRRWLWLLSKAKPQAHQRDYVLYFSNGAKRLALSLGDGKAAWYDCATAKSDWQAERWYHCAAVYEKKRKGTSWYVDGEPNGSSTSDLDVLIDTDAELTIGGRGATVDFSLDELALYGRALRPDEIAARVSARPNGPAKAPFARWTFDEGQGQSAADTSGNGNNAAGGLCPTDQTIELARRHGISVLGVIGFPPRWATNAPQDDPRPWTYMPKLEDWEEHVYRLVDHYKDRVKHWEVWNEPDIVVFWEPEPNPQDYAKVLSAAYRGAKRADRDCTVYGVSSTSAPFRRSDWTFVEAVLKAGGLRSMDVLAVHPYHFPQSPEEAGLSAFVDQTVAMMQKYGGRKGVSFTEIGVVTHINSRGSSERVQAEMLPRSYVISLASGCVDKIFWFRLWDPGIDRSYLEHAAGVVYHDWTPKPAYFAHRTLATELQDAKPLRWLRQGPDVYACLLKRQDDCVVAAWAASGRGVLTVRTGLPEVNLTDLMGNTRSERGTGGIHSTLLDGSVVLLSGMKEGAVEVLPPLVNLATRTLKVGRGECAEVRVTVANPYREALRGAAKIEIPGDLLTEEAMRAFSIAPGKRAAVSFRVRPAEHVALGECECGVRVRTAELDFALPLRIVVMSAASDSPPAGSWSFDEGAGSVARDASANHNDGKVVGAKWVKGVRGNALEFSGGEGRVEVPHSPTLSMEDEVTIEFWVKAAGATGDWQSPCAKWRSAPLRRNYGVYFHKDKGVFAFSATFANSSLPHSDFSSGFCVWDGKWHHLVVTYSQHDKEVRFYTDGALAKEYGYDGGALAAVEAPLAIGVNCPGAFDEVKVYNRAITPQEVKRSMESALR